MTLRDWTMSRVNANHDGRGTGLTELFSVGSHGFVASREDQPPAHAYCPEAGPEPFTPHDLDAAIDEMADLQFVIITKRPIANSTYAYADHIGVYVGGLAAFKSALRESDDVGTYMTRNHEYVASRFAGNKNVTGWHRIGYDAYDIERARGLRNLRIVTLNPYEVTQEEAYALINAHPEADLDALVTTNPSCMGFSPATLKAVEQAGVDIHTFRDFLASLGDPWTN